MEAHALVAPVCVRLDWISVYTAEWTARTDANAPEANHSDDSHGWFFPIYATEIHLTGLFSASASVLPASHVLPVTSDLRPLPLPHRRETVNERDSDN